MADEAAESARVTAELEKAIAADAEEEDESDPVLQEVEADFREAMQKYEAAKAAAATAKVLSR